MVSENAVTARLRLARLLLSHCYPPQTCLKIRIGDFCPFAIQMKATLHDKRGRSARTSKPEMPRPAYAKFATARDTSRLLVRAHLKAPNAHSFPSAARRRRCTPAPFPPSLRLRFTSSARRPLTETLTGFLTLWFKRLIAQSLGELSGIKLVGGDSQHRRQHNQFLIRNIPQPGFNLSQRGTADVQTGQLAMRGQLLLGQPQFPTHIANFGADDIRWIFLSRHAEIELDLNGNAPFICYASVTTPDSDVFSRFRKAKKW
jgi:hypothetical protein